MRIETIIISGSQRTTATGHSDEEDIQRGHVVDAGQLVWNHAWFWHLEVLETDVERGPISFEPRAWDMKVVVAMLVVDVLLGDVDGGTFAALVDDARVNVTIAVGVVDHFQILQQRHLYVLLE